METWGIVILIVGAVVIGLAAQYLMRGQFGWEFLLTAVGAGLGGFVASEYLGTLSNWGTELYGMRIFPALIGALVIGAVVEVVMRYTMRPTARI